MRPARPAPAARGGAACRRLLPHPSAPPRPTTARAKKQGGGGGRATPPVDYGRGWYDATRDPTGGRSVREEIGEGRGGGWGWARRLALVGADQRHADQRPGPPTAALTTAARPPRPPAAPFFPPSLHPPHPPDKLPIPFLARRKQANWEANNGKERKDLYTDNWDGSEYKGSGFNILTLLIALSVLVPAAGLAFAYWSYGTLWG